MCCRSGRRTSKIVWPILLVGRHQAFEFFKPVEDDDDLALRLSFPDHQESLAVWRDDMILRHAGKH